MSSHRAIEKLRRLAISYPRMSAASTLHGCLTACCLTRDDFDPVPPALAAALGFAPGEAPTAAMRQTLHTGLEALNDELVADDFQALLVVEDDAAPEPLAAWCQGFLRVVDEAQDIWAPWVEESAFLRGSLETLRMLAAGARGDVRDALAPGQMSFDDFVSDVADEVFDLALIPAASLPPLPAYDPGDLAAWDVEDVIARLERDGELAPRVLVDELSRRGAAVVPLIAEILARDEPWENDDVLPLHLIFALGGMGLPEADAALLVALEALEAFPEWPWWDAPSGLWPKVWPAPGPEALRACAEIFADPGRSWLLRAEALSLVAAAARAGGDLEDLIDAVAARFEHGEEDENFLSACLNFLLDFPRDRHRALIEIEVVEDPTAAMREAITAEDLEAAFLAGDRPEWEEMDDPAHFYDEDARRARRRDLALEGIAEALEETLDDEAPALHSPLRRGAPKIGRNDPCPCGSGLTYKHCCLE